MAITFLLLSLVTTFALAVSHDQPVNLKFVRLDYSLSADTHRDCGSRSMPCPNITSALEGNSSSPFPLTIELMSGSNMQHESLAVLDHLVGVQDIAIRAEPGVVMNMTLRPSQTWLLIEQCVNITLSNVFVTWANLSFGTAVRVVHSTGFTLVTSRFSGLRKNSHALIVEDSWPISLALVLFDGLQHRQQAPLGRQINYTLSALQARYSCLAKCALLCAAKSSGTLAERCEEFQNTTTLAVGICVFQRLGFYRTPSSLFDRVQSAGLYLEASAVNIDILSSVNGKRIAFGDCEFTEQSSPYDPSIRLAFDSSSTNNTITFDGCKFRNNTGSFGGVFYIKFGPRTNNSVSLVGNGDFGPCTFSDNIAYAEAGVGRISFFDSGSVFDQHSQLIIDTCQFTSNYAGAFLPLCGGCFTITTDTKQHTAGWHSFGEVPPSAFRVQIRNSVFSDNLAALGSVFYLQKTAVRFVNCSFVDSVGSAIFAESSVVSLASVNAFLYNGKFTTGGAFLLRSNSLIHIEENSTSLFLNNTVTDTGGAVLVDTQTSTSTLLQVVERITEVNISFKPCFFQVPPEALVEFGDSADRSNAMPGNINASTKVAFADNFALLGRDLYATSLLPCYETPLYPEVLNNVPVPELPSPTKRNSAGPSLSTGPAWVLFNVSTCDCLKQLDDSTYWIYHRRCDSAVIAPEYNSYVLENGGPDKITAALNATLSYITAWTEDVLLPPRHSFLLPWGTVLWRYNFLGQLGQTDAQNMANVTLYPAPGEEFTLSLGALDARLHRTQATFLLSVGSGDILLRYGGLQFHRRDRISFPAQHPLVDVALAGKPGAYGTLIVQSSGIIAQHSFYIEIPYRLQPCHPGWEPTSMMNSSDKEIHTLVQGVTVTVATTSAKSLSGLICACKNPDGSICDPNGYNVTIKAQNWAGTAHVRANRTNIFEQPRRTVITNLTAYESELKSTAADIQVQSCTTNGFYCAQTVQVDWNLRSVNPCVVGERRAGILCTVCKPGYTLHSLDFYKCHDCRRENISAGLAAYILICFVFSMVYVGLAMVFGFGTGATFDTWSFSFQVSQFLSPTLQQLVSVYTGIFYGADRCVSHNLSPSGQPATLYIVPLHLLLSLVVVYTLFRTVRWFRIKFASLSLFPTLWAAVIWCYNYIVFTSVPLLTCPKINGVHVFFLDPLVKCFAGSHLPFAVLALILVTITAVPVPIMLLFARNTEFLKPFSRVYLAPLKADRYWWIAWTMIRRFVLVLFSVSLSGTLRIFIVMLVLQLYSLVQFLAMPYRHDLDNYFEFANIAILSLQILLLLFRVNETLRYVVLFIYFAPSILAICIGIYYSRNTVIKVINKISFFLRRMRAKWYGKTFPASERQSRCDSSKALIQVKSEPRLRSPSHYEFRDPLLFDTLGEIPE